MSNAVLHLPLAAVPMSAPFSRKLADAFITSCTLLDLEPFAALTDQNDVFEDMPTPEGISMPGRLSFPVGAGQRYLRRLLRRQGASRYLPVCYPLRQAFAFVQPCLPHGLGRRYSAQYLSMLFL